MLNKLAKVGAQFFKFSKKKLLAALAVTGLAGFKPFSFFKAAELDFEKIQSYVDNSKNIHPIDIKGMKSKMEDFEKMKLAKDLDWIEKHPFIFKRFYGLDIFPNLKR